MMKRKDWDSISSSLFYYKDVKRLDQPRADKFVQNVGKVREVKTFPDGLAYTPNWLVAEHRLVQGCEPRRSAPSS